MNKVYQTQQSQTQLGLQLPYYLMTVRLKYILILQDKIYWSDWLKKGIFSADKRTGRGIITVKSNITDVMDLKILDYLSQHGTYLTNSKNVIKTSVPNKSYSRNSCIEGVGRHF